MTKRLIASTLCFMLLFSTVVLTQSIIRSKASPKTWYVPTDFPTIQSAIDSPLVVGGDTIFVYNGTYYENVVVSKSLTLIGQNKSITFIDGNRIGTVVHTIVDSVKISDFTIQNSSQDGFGLHLDVVHDCIIVGNVVHQNQKDGIFLWKSNNCEISQNEAHNNHGFAAGIGLSFSADCLIDSNNATSNDYGIYLDSSENCTIIGNNIEDNVVNGINLWNSSTCKIVSNTAVNNGETGVALGFSSKNAMINGNNVTNNKYGIWLWNKCHNPTLIENNASGNSACGIGLDNSGNSRVIANVAENNGEHGFWLDHSANSQFVGNNVTNNVAVGAMILWCGSSNVTGNRFSNNGGGVVLYRSAYSIICANFADDNKGNGIGLGECAYSNITENSASSNLENGIGIDHSTRCTITHNNVTNNGENGIYVDHSDMSEVFLNKYVDGNVACGIYLKVSRYSSIHWNNVTGSKETGIFLEFSDNCAVHGNNASNNRDHGIHLYESRNSIVAENIIANNGGNGISLDESSNTTVHGNNMTYNYNGIVLSYSSDSTIIDNIAENNADLGIGLWESERSRIERNKATNNHRHGLWLEYSGDSTVTGNILKNNTWWGLVMKYCNNCRITENSVTASANPLIMEFSSDNIIYHNNFIDNTDKPSIFESYDNIWDVGCPSGGNYWSDYSGVDLYSCQHQNLTGKDGLGDTPYIIDANNKDNYPLMKPYTPQRILIYLNKDTYHAGDTMKIGIHAINLEGLVNLCVIVWPELPDGTIYMPAVKHFHNITLPADLNYNNPNQWTYILPNILPGVYIWHAALLNPTTHEVIIEDPAPWLFS